MVRPVDLQDNLSKTKILEQVQQLQKSSPQEAQRQFGEELSKKVAQKTKSVPDMPQADKVIIHADRHSRRGDDRKKKNKKQKGQNDVPRIDFVA